MAEDPNSPDVLWVSTSSLGSLPSALKQLDHEILKTSEKKQQSRSKRLSCSRLQTSLDFSSSIADGCDAKNSSKLRIRQDRYPCGADVTKLTLKDLDVSKISIRSPRWKPKSSVRRRNMEQHGNVSDSKKLRLIQSCSFLSDVALVDSFFGSTDEERPQKRKSPSKPMRKQRGRKLSSPTGLLGERLQASDQRKLCVDVECEKQSRIDYKVVARKLHRRLKEAGSRFAIIKDERDELLYQVDSMNQEVAESTKGREELKAALENKTEQLAMSKSNDRREAKLRSLLDAQKLHSLKRLTGILRNRSLRVGWGSWKQFSYESRLRGDVKRLRCLSSAEGVKNGLATRCCALKKKLELMKATRLKQRCFSRWRSLLLSKMRLSLCLARLNELAGKQQEKLRRCLQRRFAQWKATAGGRRQEEFRSAVDVAEKLRRHLAMTMKALEGAETRQLRWNRRFLLCKYFGKLRHWLLDHRSAYLLDHLATEKSKKFRLRSCFVKWRGRMLARKGLLQSQAHLLKTCLSRLMMSSHLKLQAVVWRWKSMTMAAAVEQRVVTKVTDETKQHKAQLQESRLKKHAYLLFNRLLCKCFTAWKKHVDGIRLMRRKCERFKICLSVNSVKFRVELWKRYVARQKQNRQLEARATAVVHKIRARAVLKRWKAFANLRKQETSLMRRVLGLLAHRKLFVGFEKWKAVTRQYTRVLNLFRRVVQLSSLLHDCSERDSLAGALQKWRSFSYKSHSSSILAAQHSKVVILTERCAVLEDRVEKQRLKVQSNEQARHSVLRSVVKLRTRMTMLLCVSRWRCFLWSAKRQALLLTTCLQSIRSGVQLSRFQLGFTTCLRTRHQKELLLRVFSSWTLHTTRAGKLCKKKASLNARRRHRISQHCLRVWKQYTSDRLMMKRCLQLMLAKRLGAAWKTWSFVVDQTKEFQALREASEAVHHARKKAVQKFMLRLCSSKLQRAFRCWTSCHLQSSRRALDEATNAIASLQAGRLRRVLHRMSSLNAHKGFYTWKENARQSMEASKLQRREATLVHTKTSSELRLRFSLWRTVTAWSLKQASTWDFVGKYLRDKAIAREKSQRLLDVWRSNTKGRRTQLKAKYLRRLAWNCRAIKHEKEVLKSSALARWKNYKLDAVAKKAHRAEVFLRLLEHQQRKRRWIMYRCWQAWCLKTAVNRCQQTGTHHLHRFLYLWDLMIDLLRKNETYSFKAFATELTRFCIVNFGTTVTQVWVLKDNVSVVEAAGIEVSPVAPKQASSRSMLYINIINNEKLSLTVLEAQIKQATLGEVYHPFFNASSQHGSSNEESGLSSMLNLAPVLVIRFAPKVVDKQETRNGMEQNRFLLGRLMNVVEDKIVAFVEKSKDRKKLAKKVRRLEMKVKNMEDEKHDEVTECQTRLDRIKKIENKISFSKSLLQNYSFLRGQRSRKQIAASSCEQD